MRAIVHIGAPKTGTSSIQQFLQTNRTELAARGIRYHREVSDRGSQFELPMAAMLAEGVLPRGEDNRARYRAIDADMQRREYGHVADLLKMYPSKFDEPVALFSSEHALPWLSSVALIGRFDNLFRAAFDDVRYVVYLRAQHELIVSQYSEQMKRGNSIGLDQFLTQRLRAMDHFRQVNRWAETVGRDRIDVRLTERDFLKDGDLLTDLCHVCRIDDTGLARPLRINEALSAVGCEVMRGLNTRIPELLPNGRRNPLREGVLEAVAAMTDQGPKLRLSESQLDILRGSIRQSNSRLHEMFFSDRPALFSAPGCPATDGELMAIKDEAIDVLAELFVRMRLGEMPRMNILNRWRAIRLAPEPAAGAAAEGRDPHQRPTGTITTKNFKRTAGET